LPRYGHGDGDDVNGLTAQRCGSSKKIRHLRHAARRLTPIRRNLLGEANEALVGWCYSKNRTFTAVSARLLCAFILPLP
jgi:hypothetical protein